MSTLDVESKWNIHPDSCYYHIQNNIVQIGDSIWYRAGVGMVEYSLHSEKILQIVKLPFNMEPKELRARRELAKHAVCKHYDKIYLISGENGQIVEFDPISKEFTIRFECEYGEVRDRFKIAAEASVAVIGDNIHIYNGCNNDQSIAFVYNILSNKIVEINDEFAKDRADDVCLVKYRNQLIRFGGHKYEEMPYRRGYKHHRMNWFLLGVSDVDFINTWISKYEHKYSLKSTQIPAVIVDVICQFYGAKHGYNWHKLDDKIAKLHKRYCECGYIIYQHFIITFGGNIGGTKHCDTIFVLNLRDKKKGWIESKVRCPEKDGYRAILTSTLATDDVHLFGIYTLVHCSMRVTNIIKAANSPAIV